jgi:hypothetical protein
MNEIPSKPAAKPASASITLASQYTTEPVAGIWSSPPATAISRTIESATNENPRMLFTLTSIKIVIQNVEDTATFVHCLNLMASLILALSL